MMSNEGTEETIDVAWFCDRLPPGAVLDKLLAGDPVTELLGITRSRAPIEVIINNPDPGADPAVMQQLELAVRTVERLKTQGRAASLSPEETQALQAFVYLVTRPALRVDKGEVPSPNRAWSTLDSAREVVARRIRGVGRLDTFKGTGLGTGWLAAPGLLLTNKHVVAALCDIDIRDPFRKWIDLLTQRLPRYNSQWQTDAALRPRWDTGDSPTADTVPTGLVRHVRAVHPQFDIALLEVDCADDTSDRVLNLSAAPPAQVDGQQVYVAGYPAVGPVRDVHPALVALLFGNSEETCKRVAPGLLHGVADGVLQHDASTLGGNSGSVVIDLATHRVVGLHFSGTPWVSNNAVALWTLKDDPFFAGTGIRFV